LAISALLTTREIDRDLLGFRNIAIAGLAADQETNNRFALLSVADGNSPNAER
jgi:hypothetical protein